jgi:hypothetical protein
MTPISYLKLVEKWWKAPESEAEYAVSLSDGVEEER